jgi:hypothetical protein
VTLKTRFLLLTAAILVAFALGGSMASTTVDALRPEGEAMLAVRDDNALLADVAPPTRWLTQSALDGALRLRYGIAWPEALREHELAARAGAAAAAAAEAAAADAAAAAAAEAADAAAAVSRQPPPQ